MNRFQKKKEFRNRRKQNGLHMSSVLLLAGAFVLFGVSVHSVTAQTQKQQKNSLEKAIRRDMVQCYAMEGHYPESLEYLEEHYGLTWDKDRFFVVMEVFGSNMMPDVTVAERGK